MHTRYMLQVLNTTRYRVVGVFSFYHVIRFFSFDVSGLLVCVCCACCIQYDGMALH